MARKTIEEYSQSFVTSWHFVVQFMINIRKWHWRSCSVSLYLLCSPWAKPTISLMNLGLPVCKIYFKQWVSTAVPQRSEKAYYIPVASDQSWRHRQASFRCWRWIWGATRASGLDLTFALDRRLNHENQRIIYFRSESTTQLNSLELNIRDLKNLWFP